MTRIGWFILIIFLMSTYETPSVSEAGNAAAHFQAASVLVQQERYADALAEFREVIRVSANQEEIEGALYWIGQCYQRQGKLDEARDTFNQLVAEYPNSELVPMARVFLEQIPAVEYSPDSLLQLRYQRLEPPQVDTENNGTYWDYETKQWLTISPDEKQFGYVKRNQRGWMTILIASLEKPELPAKPLVTVQDESRENDGQRVSIHHLLYEPTWSPDGKWMAYYHRTTTSTQRAPFALGSALKEDLNRSGSISANLRQAFDNNDAPLSPNAVLSVDQSDHVWRITDEINGMEYHISYYRNSFRAQPDDDHQKKSETKLYIVPVAGGETQLVVKLAELSTNRTRMRGLSWSADSKRLAYVLYKDAELEESGIYIASIDGTEIEQFADGDIGIPVWSPDGKWIAFSAWRKFLFWQRPGVWVRSVETGKEYKIPNSIGNPVWSPDGKAIAYTGMLNWFGNHGILGAAIKNGKPIGEPYLISREKLNAIRGIFHWSKDGKLTFLREDHKKELYIVATARPRPVKRNTAAGLETYQWMPDGNRLLIGFIPNLADFHFGYVQANRGEGFQKLQLTRKGLQIVEAVPSPDGRKLALTAIQIATFQQMSIENPWPSMGIHLYTVDADGQNLKQITHGKTVNGGPRWSPDSKQIAFSRVDVANGWRSSIYLIAATGGEAIPLTVDFNDRDMSWSPDGKRIAFLRGRGKNPDPDESDSDIFVLPASGGQAKQLSTDQSKKYNLHWSPDGKYLSYDKSGEVWIVPASGRKPRRMATAANTGSNPNRWSPDGKSLLTVRGRSIWTHPVEGGDPTEIEIQGFSEQIDDPTWSPDGTQIAFRGRVVDFGWWRVQVKQ